MSRPNLFILLADQLRADVLGVNGSTICRTPHLDRLARDGVNFGLAFTTTPLCSPARAALFTGRYPHSNGLIANTHYPDTPSPCLPERERLLFQHLATAGYRCGYVGKWHLNVGEQAVGAQRRGVADFYGGRRAAQLHRERLSLPPREDVAGARRRTMEGPHPPMCGVAPYPEEYHLDAGIAGQAVALLRQYVDEGLGGPDRPFALVCSFHGPHFPLEVPEPYADLYDPAAVPKPGSFDDALAEKPPAQRTHPWLQLAAHLSWPEWQRVIAAYWSFVTLIDELTGRVLRALEELGLDEETLVVTTSDHGDMAGHHRMFDKGPYFYEDVMRVPSVWRWPGHVPPLQNEQRGFISHVDVVPTLLELLDVDPVAGAPPLQGVSRVPVLIGDPAATRGNEVFGESNAGDLVNPQLDARMIRTRRWKYAWRPGDVDELYDLEADPEELANLAAATKHAAALQQLRVRLAAWMQETEDPLPVPI